MDSELITLHEFIIEREREFKFASGDLSNLLRAIMKAGKVINRNVNRAALVGLFGPEGGVNKSGEEQQKLDVFANNQLIDALRRGGEVCGISSEENEDIVAFENERGKYVVLFDPLDGSSNIDVNISIGTIFSIYRRLSLDGKPELEDFLQQGNAQVAAGYIIYGSSTMLVYTTGHGVNGFTHDPAMGEFYLTHPDMKIPEQGSIYSVNESSYGSFDDGVKSYVDYCKENDPESGRPYNARYIGSLVADFHRNLIKGGIFIYPGSRSKPSGKLRLLFECNPLAYIVEQAGGKATNGFKPILDVRPKELHQRSPLFIGSAAMVDMAGQLIAKQAAV